MTVSVSGKCLGKDVSVWAREDCGENKVYITPLSHYLFANQMNKMRAAQTLFF